MPTKYSTYSKIAFTKNPSVWKLQPWSLQCDPRLLLQSVPIILITGILYLIADNKLTIYSHGTKSRCILNYIPLLLNKSLHPRYAGQHVVI